MPGHYQRFEIGARGVQRRGVSSTAGADHSDISHGNFHASRGRFPATNSAENQLGVIVEVMTPVDPGVSTFANVELVLDSFGGEQFIQLVRVLADQRVFLADRDPKD